MVETPCPSDEIVMWSVLESVERGIMKKERGVDGWVNGWMGGQDFAVGHRKNRRCLQLSYFVSSWPFTGHHR